MQIAQIFKKYWPLALILFGTAFLRVYALDRGDPISDEVLYGFRAIGMLDFDFATVQPTTLQLFADRGMPIPSWTRLSFHDHPILVFLVQHVFMNVLGPSLWGLRLPSALFGIASILLLYLLGTKLFSERVGLIATAFAGANVLLLYASRTGVQEAQVIFFILLTVYCFLRALDDGRWFFAWGAAFGLALLSKYTAGLLVLPFAVYLVLYHRSVFVKKQFYGGLLLFVIFFSPAIIYNLKLYQAFGHFDFQLSYIFGQNVAEWKEAPGKEIGSFADRIAEIPSNLIEYNEFTFNILSLAAVAALLFVVFHNRRQKQSEYLLLFLIAGTLLLYLGIGPSPRFLTLLIPWFALSMAYAVDAVLGVIPKPRAVLLTIGLVLIISWQTFFAFNSYVRARPLGSERWSYSRIHWDMHPWGFNELDRFLARTVDGAYPQMTVPYSYDFLEDVKTRAIAKAKDEQKVPKSYLFVYDGSMSDLATLWTLNRRSLYQAWPMIEAENYLAARSEKGDRFYFDSGFTDIFFVRGTDAVLGHQSGFVSQAGAELEAELREQGVSPQEIRNAEGALAFKLYHVTATDY